MTTTNYTIESCERELIRSLIDTSAISNENQFKHIYLVRKSCEMKSNTYNGSWYNKIQNFCKQICANKNWEIFEYADIPCLADYHFDRLYANGEFKKRYGSGNKSSVRQAYDKDMATDKAMYDKLLELSRISKYTIEMNQQVLDLCKHFNDRNGSVFIKALTDMKSCFSLSITPDASCLSTSDIRRPDDSNTEWVDLFKFYNVVPDDISEETIINMILQSYEDADDDKPDKYGRYKRYVQKPNSIEGIQNVYLIKPKDIERAVQGKKNNHTFESSTSCYNNNYYYYVYPKDANTTLDNLSFKKIMQIAERHLNMKGKGKSVNANQLVNCESSINNPEDSLWNVVKGMHKGERMLVEVIHTQENNSYYGNRSVYKCKRYATPSSGK